ncbi:MAG: uncharacterized protein K0R24_1112 [Gammaproteobacteria bacterium]|nr:uncharacterized protein [Gammaproteobacteria bacterium]
MSYCLHYHIRQQALLEACRIAGGETALANAIGVWQSRLGNWICDPAMSPDYKYALLISDLTGVSIERLCPGETDVNQLVKNRDKKPYKAIPQIISLTSINVEEKQYRDDLSIDIAKKPILIDEKQHLLCGYTTFRFYQQKGQAQVPVIIMDAITLLAGLYDPLYLQSLVPISERALLGEYLENRMGNHQGKRTDLLRKRISTEEHTLKTPKMPFSAPQLLQNFAEVDLTFFAHDKRTRIAHCLGFNNHESYRQARVIVQYAIPDLIQAVDEKRCALYRAVKVAREAPVLQAAFVKEHIPSQSRSKPSPFISLNLTPLDSTKEEALL